MSRVVQKSRHAREREGLNSYLLDNVDVEMVPDTVQVDPARVSTSLSSNPDFDSTGKRITKKPYPAWFMPIRRNMFRVWLFCVL